MLFLLGLFVVVGSVITGYTMHHGELILLYQPNELIIIIGSGIGATIIGTPFDLLKETIISLKYLFKTRHKSKKDYLELLGLCFNMFKLIKIKGMLAVESHIETPQDSDIFKSSPSFMRDKRALSFFRDHLRILSMGVDDHHQFAELVESEVEIYHHEALGPSRVVNSLGDSLPALGIVAAVLGVIITMRSITEPPAVLGSLIAAALVGTFTGVLFAYGLFNPIANYLKLYAEQKAAFLMCIKAGLVSHTCGNAPVITVEFMRKAIPENIRPDFYETDEFINASTKG
ncbi:MAG: flagellar motor stator protein MotA [Rickettsiaceae bacterium]|nr:flagellar motor stator protein MotA [Rickettsiaceae bacterium]